MKKVILIFIALILGLVVIGLGISTVKSLLMEQKGNEVDATMKKGLFKVIENFNESKE